MRPQGTTEADIAATRVPRSVAFFVTTLTYGLVLIVGMHPGGVMRLPGEAIYGWVVLVFSVALAIMSLLEVHVAHPARLLCFAVLSGVFIGLLGWDIVLTRYQAAALLIYPTATCWIETYLALRVTWRERAERERAARERASILASFDEPERPPRRRPSPR